MKHTVLRKQPNSKMCLVCGLQNPLGLHAYFYELDNDGLLAIFRPKEEHQGYPNRLHGGIITALLDESIGRAINVNRRKQLWGVTLDFSVKFKKPVPLEVEVRVLSRINGEGSRVFEGSGEVLLPDGEVAATGRGRYLKLAIEKIADFDLDHQQWRVVPADSDPQVVEL